MKANLNFNRRQWLAATFGFLATTIASPILAQTKIRRIRTQYIAALGAEGATSGTGAETWGLWKEDPGPIGVSHTPIGPGSSFQSPQVSAPVPEVAPSAPSAAIY